MKLLAKRLALANETGNSRRHAPGLAATSLLLALATTSAALAQAGPPVWEAQADLRIGSIDGAPYGLTTINSLVVSDRTGAVFIAQGDGIRVFDPLGKHLRTIGREGGGPGEFQFVSMLGWTGDLLVAYDSGLRRLTWFTEDGQVRRTHSVRTAPEGSLEHPLTGGGYAALLGVPIAAASDGRIILQYVGGGDGISEGTLTSLPVISTGGAGEDRTLDHLDVRGTHKVFQTATRARVEFRPPLVWRSLVAAQPRGASVAFVHQEEPESAVPSRFRVRRVSSGGEVMYARTYQYTPRRLPPAAEDSVLDSQMSGPGPRAAGMTRSEVRRILSLPAFWPAISGVLVGGDGSVWLEGGNDGPVATWWVLNPAGDPVGAVRLPRGTRLLHAREGEIWTAQRDDLDVTYAVRMRVNAAAW